MSSQKVSKILLNNNLYYFVEEIKQACPAFFYGCAKTSRMIIEKKKINNSDYLYATYAPKSLKWKQSDETVKSAKLLLNCKWVEQNVPSWKSEEGNITNEEKLDLEAVPPLLELKDEDIDLTNIIKLVIQDNGDSFSCDTSTKKFKELHTFAKQERIIPNPSLKINLKSKSYSDMVSDKKIKVEPTKVNKTVEPNKVDELNKLVEPIKVDEPIKTKLIDLTKAKTIELIKDVNLVKVKEELVKPISKFFFISELNGNVCIKNKIDNEEENNLLLKLKINESKEKEFLQQIKLNVSDNYKEISPNVFEDNNNQITKKILDIGCNDGTLLDFYKKKNCITIGVEPTNEIDLTPGWASRESTATLSP